MSAIRMTEADLANIGLTVEGTQVVLVDPDKKPDPSWTVEQLAIYAKGKMAASAQAEKEAILQARKSAVELFEAGAALWLIRDKLKTEKGWVAWQKTNKLARSTVLEAIALYENAKSPDALVGLGITEAKERFGVVKPRPTPQITKPSGKRAASEGPASSPKPEPLPPVDYESQLRQQIQIAVSDLESWTLNDLGRASIPDEQRTTWKNLVASLRAAAKRIEDYVGEPQKKGKHRAA